MATFYDLSALDALLEVIRSGVGTGGKVVLINGYTQGDTWATVDGNTIAEATIDDSTTYFTAGLTGTSERTLNFLGAVGVATATATPAADDLHIGLIDGSTVYAVTNETSNQAITDTNPVTFPAFYMRANQPVQA